MPANPLQAAHEELNAFLAERAGTKVPLRFGDSAAEHRAVRSAVGVADLTAEGKILVRGSERMRFLNAVLGADLGAVASGRGCYSLMLSRDGRVASEMRVAVTDDWVLLLTPPITRGKVLRTLERMVVTADVKLEDATGSLVLLSIQGPLTQYVASAVVGTLLPELPVSGVAEVKTRLGKLILVRSHRTGEEGLDVLVPAAEAEWIYRRFVAEVKTSGGLPCGLDAMESLRVECGRPSFGAEIDETTLPSEIPEAADVAQGLCMTKGCFLGRETAAADLEQALPARRLAGIVFGSRVPPVRGDKLFHLGRSIGAVTSGAYSPGLDRGIALAMMEPYAIKAGTDVTTADGEPGVVHALPFPRSMAK